jgi:hypothetical protein
LFGLLNLEKIQVHWKHHVRLAYQTPASSTFLSEQTSHQYFSQNKLAPAISQTNKQHLLRKILTTILHCSGVAQTSPEYRQRSDAVWFYASITRKTD